MHAFASMCRTATSTRYYRDESLPQLAAAEAALKAAGLAFTRHIHVGDAAGIIAKLAADHGCARIVMGTHGRSALAEAVLGSVSHRVLQLARARCCWSNERAMNDGSARRLDLPIAGMTGPPARHASRKYSTACPGSLPASISLPSAHRCCFSRMKRRRSRWSRRSAGRFFRCRRSRSSWRSAA